MTDRDLISEGREKLADAELIALLHRDLGRVVEAQIDGEWREGNAALIVWALNNLPAVLDQLEQARLWAEWFSMQRDLIANARAQELVAINAHQQRTAQTITELSALRDRMTALADQADKSTPDDWGVHYVYTYALRAAIEGRSDD